SDDFINAQINVNNMFPSEVHLVNAKDVFKVYLQTFAVEQYDFTAQQEQTLQAVACQDGLNGGPAVYMAREMLGPFHLCNNGAKSLEATPTAVWTESATVFPNPSAGLTYFEFPCDDEVCDAQLHIFDITGKEIYSKNVPAEYGLIEVDLSAHPGGVYVYSLIVGGQTHSGKLLIQ
ncbi:MAG: T9SS type A sorting domain-containing protein, partial [Bacteroidota bacterium]